MYLVPTEIKDSTIEGKGVFALEKINKGEIVWRFDSKHDLAISKQEFDALSGGVKKELERIAYLSSTSDRYVYPPENDAANYTNHSTENNLEARIDPAVSEEPYFIANRDIQVGEELTNNYLEFDAISRGHNPHWI